MASSQLRSFLATGVVLLTILGPSEGFLELVVGYFFSNFLWGAPSKIANRVSQAALEPAQSLLLGGGTEIVSQALTHDYIPGMRDFVWNAVGTSVSQLGSLAVSAIWWIISSIGSAIGTSLGAAIPAGVAAGNAVIAAIASIIAASVNGNILQNENDPAMQLQVVPQQRAAASRSFRSDAPLVRLLRGRRNVGPTPEEDLRHPFVEAARHDPYECVPLVLCAIHADPEELVTPKESAFRKVFRSIFAKDRIPSWAKRYVEASVKGSTSQSTHACRETYPSCTFPSHYLRKLVNIALEKGNYLTQR
ncbi:uncharacterized protein LOC122261181 [Penaeus japonicus]|uniref:uncharacterized protein LOC122261181 n=1 Tax=Penaeus japonicus TaxID=27405 RepID=UPI001C713A19|nr:uncharacterized protein LOC122261181 [Penaeus japonicus]